MSTQRCALDCCDSPLCLQLNASSYGNGPQGPWGGLRSILLQGREARGQTLLQRAGRGCVARSPLPWGLLSFGAGARGRGGPAALAAA